MGPTRPFISQPKTCASDTRSAATLAAVTLCGARHSSTIHPQKTFLSQSSEGQAPRESAALWQKPAKIGKAGKDIPPG